MVQRGCPFGKFRSIPRATLYMYEKLISFIKITILLKYVPIVLNIILLVLKYYQNSNTNTELGFGI